MGIHGKRMLPINRTGNVDFPVRKLAGWKTGAAGPAEFMVPLRARFWDCRLSIRRQAEHL